MRVFEGGCLCGRLRYRAEGEPILVDYCHCGMCRRSSGAPVQVWATFGRDQIRFTHGTPKEFRSSADSVRYFCAECGGALALASPGEALFGVTIGSLDRPDGLAPRQHSWTADRLGWFHIGDSLPDYPGESPELMGET